jgi:peptidoglycan/xylan/chitin deacetylase (PgdA/CDA1 family)
MWSAGFAWDDEGYTMACAHPDGRTLGPLRFRADDVAGMVGQLAAVCGAGVTGVVESTNGLLDGPLRRAGLRVLRADPWNLPDRPATGSVPALVLARQGLPGGGRPVETDDASGTLKGRVHELELAQRQSVRTTEALARQGRFLERGPAELRQVALTFDDGPSAPFTDQVIEILRDYAVPATFFCVGLHAKAAPGTLARLTEEGHGIGNHTWSHPFLPDLSRDELLFQIDATSAAIAAVTGEAPGLLRPPYGSQTPDTLRWSAESGLTTVMWDQDTEDWSQPGSAAIASGALDRVTGGSVVLMHDGGGDRSQTVAALPVVVESLLDRGFRLVTVDHMLAGLPTY